MPKTKNLSASVTRLLFDTKVNQLKTAAIEAEIRSYKAEGPEAINR